MFSALLFGARKAVPNVARCRLPLFSNFGLLTLQQRSFSAAPVQGKGLHLFAQKIEHKTAPKKFLTSADYPDDFNVDQWEDEADFDAAKVAAEDAATQEEEIIEEAARKKGPPKAILRFQKLDEKGRAYGTGRRKRAIARVRIWPGTGKMTVNKKLYVEYFDARNTLIYQLIK